MSKAAGDLRSITMGCEDLAKSIHKQLVGNPDYIENKIILNFTDPIQPRHVTLTVFDDASNFPDIDLSAAGINS